MIFRKRRGRHEGRPRKTAATTLQVQADGSPPSDLAGTDGAFSAASVALDDLVVAFMVYRIQDRKSVV